MFHQQGRQTDIQTFLLCCIYIKLCLHGKTLTLYPMLEDGSMYMSGLGRKVLLSQKNITELSGLFKLKSEPC